MLSRLFQSVALLPQVRRPRHQSHPPLPPHCLQRQPLAGKSHELISIRELRTMNPTDVPLRAPTAESNVSIRDVEHVERALIDASTRAPVLFFYASAVVWLIIGTLLAGLTSFKLHAPDLLANISFLTWGRIRPAHMNVMVFGWASMVGIW